MLIDDRDKARARGPLDRRRVLVTLWLVLDVGRAPPPALELGRRVDVERVLKRDQSSDALLVVLALRIKDGGHLLTKRPRLGLVP